MPESFKIHLVFHISLLKKFSSTLHPHSPTLPQHTYNNQPLIQPSVVVDTRQKHVNHHWITQLLVHWDGYSLEEAISMDKSQFHKAYSNFHLEDKVELEGVSIATDKEVIVPNVEQTTSIMEQMQEDNEITTLITLISSQITPIEETKTTLLSNKAAEYEDKEDQPEEKALRSVESEKAELEKIITLNGFWRSRREQGI